MIIADTSIWIEYLKQRDPIFQRVEVLLEIAEILAVECIFGELLQGARNKREREIVEGYWENLPRADEKGLWIEAGLYSGRHKLFAKGVGLIDAAIIVAARRGKAKIWTLDIKLSGILPPEIQYAGNA